MASFWYSCILMKTNPKQSADRRILRGFSLVEVLVVVVIISVLLTAGVVGLNNLGGRGVSSGVDSAEALFDEARALAVGKNLRTAVLVARELTNNPAEDRRRILVAHEELDADGDPVQPPESTNLTWVVTSRGALLPDQTFFSGTFSRKNHTTKTGDIPTIADARIKDVKAAYQGTYYVYQFSNQGIPWDPTANVAMPGASFVIGSGSRVLTQPASTQPPKVAGSARRDFGGFVIWRNGRTSLFRSPEQISTELQNITPGTNF